MPQSETLLSIAFFCHVHQAMSGRQQNGSIKSVFIYFSFLYMPKKAKKYGNAYVLKGALLKQGMPNFTRRLTAEDVEKINAFIQTTADAVKKSGQQKN